MIASSFQSRIACKSSILQDRAIVKDFFLPPNFIQLLLFHGMKAFVSLLARSHEALPRSATRLKMVIYFVAVSLRVGRIARKDRSDEAEVVHEKRNNSRTVYWIAVRLIHFALRE